MGYIPTNSTHSWFIFELYLHQFTPKFVQFNPKFVYIWAISPPIQPIWCLFWGAILPPNCWTYPHKFSPYSVCLAISPPIQPIFGHFLGYTTTNSTNIVFIVWLYLAKPNHIHHIVVIVLLILGAISPPIQPMFCYFFWTYPHQFNPCFVHFLGYITTNTTNMLIIFLAVSTPIHPMLLFIFGLCHYHFNTFFVYFLDYITLIHHTFC